MSTAFRIHTSKGILGISVMIARSAAPYISLVFAKVNTVPLDGQVILGIIVVSAVWLAGQAAYAYYFKKTGLKISIKWRWNGPNLGVTYR